MISSRLANETVVMLPGPAGQLELLVGTPHGEPKQAWGIVCHPHSLHGGSMHNKIVTTLIKTFQCLGLNTVRFNFRGVGLSEGKYDHGNGEFEDLLAVIDWMQRENPQFSIWMAGFSFGAYIAAKAATQIPISKLVLIAPPVKNFPMLSMLPFLCPWVLVQGEKDEVVSAEDVLQWAANREPAPLVIRFPEASHFFHGQLVELRQELEKALKTI